MMIATLLALGAESRDVSSTKTCFDNAVTNAVRALMPLQRTQLCTASLSPPSASRNFCSRLQVIAAPIKLELLTWSSQKLVTRVAEILMREKLGYLDVSVRDYSGSGEDTSGYAYNRTASGEVSFNFELWPTFYEKEREAALSADSPGARPLGYHTFSARSGWYVPIKSLGAHVPQNWTRNDDAAQWRVFDYEMCAARATAAQFSPSGAIRRTPPTAKPSHLCTGTRRSPRSSTLTSSRRSAPPTPSHPKTSAPT